MGMGRGATAGIPEDKGGGTKKEGVGRNEKAVFSRENGLFHAVFSNKYSCNVFDVPASLSRPYVYKRPVSNLTRLLVDTRIARFYAIFSSQNAYLPHIHHLYILSI